MPTNKAKPDTDGQIPPAAKAIAVAMLVPMSLVPIGVGLTVIRTFICPHCSAPLTDLADIPASGEVQCSFCHGLFNVRAG
jgi:hypothetical protein